MSDAPAKKPTHAVRESRIPAELAGQRFDQALARLFPEYSRSRLTQWIREEHALLDERPARPRDTVMDGQRVRLTVVEEPRTDVGPEDLPLTVVHEDAALIVVNKPAGLVVHPARGHHTGTLAQALAGRAAGGEDPYRAGIVHRLDRDTSGLLVVAKSDEVHRALKALLADRQLRREYLTLVE
ncbi:MAG: pseudouridine synthase, partial [Gammaproteobacteria bacterium]